ncbi:TetR family transcriptional regulator [Caulobacter sp. Root655]|uniref:TetR/AcrR family transcriptional regulator n=1 Tax=Caulobacter sp. Root655 TaxID=1736578 RepID=UPI0006F9533A|nr:TetR/AcrR family transcriptional regulator [Caulobacter sp. Root655]KRA56777.1 TetR family transcriptional regulator [Caulobacter sp. Root655]
MAERGRPRGFDRDLALAKAMEVFWARGYEGASMTDLTAAMGIASPSLYAAFGCKEALFREALRLYAATESDGIWGGLETAPTARAGFESFLYATARVFTRPGKPTGCLVVLSALNASELNQTVREELVRGRAAMADGLEARLKRGQRDGDVQAGADTRAIAAYFATVQQGMSIQARDGATRATLEAIARVALSGWDSLVGA